ncbi:hypothetical protein D1B31_14870 [Neobacillus notoginsengisoli]|uniref:DUF1797 family protein n=1 Tax=Neobacillus notoginsengisoli TaxID=1578198 RepID=A0A417YRZ5_9BACI|nr:hypothetical protein [Neobacillus notoginsengisoli]RHW38060.1 hypothetical protein D1B31_14870 [Neobacillus notoginsengisoli]
MEFAKIRHLAEELKEVPYIGSDVTHVFKLEDRKLLSLKYSRDLKLFQVTRIEGQIVTDYTQAEQAAAEIQYVLESYSEK